MADWVTMFMYSARKNMAKRMPVYSVWNPPTSSCSASTRSKGARLVSATAAMQKMAKGTEPASRNQSRGLVPGKPWAATMAAVDRVPAWRTAPTIPSPRAAS